MARKAFPLTDLGVKVVPPFDTYYIQERQRYERENL